MLKPPRTVSAQGQSLTRHFESCRLQSYQDTRGRWTAGYGTTGPDIVEGMTITQAQADAWLDARLEDVAAILNSNLPAGATQGQFDALADFGYNEGIAAMLRSQMWAHVAKGDTVGALREMATWIYGHNAAGELVELAWQIKRRAAEAELYRTGQWTPPA